MVGDARSGWRARLGIAFARENSRRALILCATGAVLGLLIAGYGLFTAQGTRIAGVPPEDVAMVNAVPILRVDFDNQVRALYSVTPEKVTAQQRRSVLDTMIREELYVQRGLELGIPTDDIDVRAALVAATEASTTADILASRPAPQELADYYAANRMRWATEGTMLAEDFIVANPADVQAARAALRTGGKVSGLTRTTRFGDGEEYWFAARLHLGPILFQATRGLRDGEVSAPVAANGHVHLIRMLHLVPPAPRPFEAIRDKVLADFQKDKAARIEAANDRYLRRRADIQIAGDVR